jgi:hypothetical protein
VTQGFQKPKGKTMTVLTLAGKPINWAKPPKPQARVMWSQKTTGGRLVTGSLRTIAHLDRLNSLSIKKFSVGISVIQGPYNTGVAASAGTHDFDACLDVWINGVDGYVQQAFFRANGGGAYFRTPAQGFSPHIHYFTLPEREGTDPSDDYRSGGFKVGVYVDGGWSTKGARVASSQIEDYYEERSALSGHLPDPTWFPADKAATIFDLNAYIARKRIEAKPVPPKVPDALVSVNSHGPLARLGKQGPVLWAQWETNMRKEIVAVDGLPVLTTSDTNKHGALPKFGPGFRRIGGKGIDLIGLTPVKASSVKVLRRKVVDLHIDGHNAHGTQVQVTFPSGRKVTFWIVQANIGRGTEAQVRASAKALRRAFGTRAVYGLDEIDEGDVSNEHAIFREVFTKADGFALVGWNTLSPTIVGPVLAVKDVKVTLGCPGYPKVTPKRDIVVTTLTPPARHSKKS